jgi:S-disulfanyl-L-cysteine oxidoreductase SoxD
MGKSLRYSSALRIINGFISSITILYSIGCAQADGAPAAERPAGYGLGHVPSQAEIAAVNIDVNPAGVGLPPGQGTASTGATTYALKCAACHGPNGEGIGPNPKLVGTDPAAGFAFASDAKVPKTIGNYWPYATTLYDYIHRAMPLSAPGSLTPDETYGLVAFLLSKNGLVPTTMAIDAKSLPGIVMPARRYFVRDNRAGGRTFR